MLGAAIVARVLATQTVFEITLPWVALGTPLLREGFTALFVTLMTVGGSGLPGKKV